MQRVDGRRGGRPQHRLRLSPTAAGERGGSFHPSQPNERGGSFQPSQPNERGDSFHTPNERFAAAWDEAQRVGWPPADEPWIESALCFFEGRSPPPDNPVRITNIGQVIEAMRGNRFVRRPRAKRS